jgi:hypothetical protein
MKTNIKNIVVFKYHYAVLFAAMLIPVSCINRTTEYRKKYLIMQISRIAAR